MPSATIPHGGTLRVAIPRTGLLPDSAVWPGADTWDVAQDNATPDVFEVLRCCLARTMLSYTGQPTRLGGADLRPDLATQFPDVSPDGLTWTFHLRQGLHYAPPLQRVEITAADFVRTLQRDSRLSGGGFFSDIDGAAAFRTGDTQSIPGLQTPDAHTLVVRLMKPAGDLAARFALPFVVPLPPLLADPSAPFGVAAGHDSGLTGFIVSSGPYMLAGGDKVDFALPPAQQQPASGLVPGKSITLVRNPSWSAASDPLRPAYVDRIVFNYGGTVNEAVAALEGNQADAIIAESPPPQIPVDTVQAWEADPRKGSVVIEPRDAVRYISMNLATPPFDDIHVRRAVAFVLDRKKIEDAFGGAISGTVTGHLAFDSMEDNALVNYDPYRTGDDQARLSMARQEMARSAYDSAHTGSCDAAVCQHVAGVALGGAQLPQAMVEIARANLLQIGIHADITSLPGKAFFQASRDPARLPPLGLFWAWLKDYPNGADFFIPLFSKEALDGGAISHTLIGATSQQLAAWGYSVTSVPDVDDRIDSCRPLVGDAQIHCWTSLDQYLMEKVAAVLPFVAESYVQLVPARLAHYSYDQSINMPALDQIALAR
jgi:peptide/nickel transport system substrate-binding protein